MPSDGIHGGVISIQFHKKDVTAIIPQFFCTSKTTCSGDEAGNPWRR
ncbi:hypothetical protein ACP70R_030029 [Stipagrostis hirtigluma subsp. patula]